jgi:hypothetical protein
MSYPIKWPQLAHLRPVSRNPAAYHAALDRLHHPNKYPLPGEIPLKQWIVETAQAEAKPLGCIWARYFRGKYNQAIKIRRVNKRLVYVSRI